MRLMQGLRWLAFVFYVFGLLAVPPALLWGLPGLAGGLALGLLVLAAMRLDGVKHLCQRLGAKPLSASEAPALHTLASEFSRRLGIACPKLLVIESKGLNVGAFGFHTQQMHIVFARGVLLGLSRSQQAALLARALCHVARHHVANETWLARFFDSLQWLVSVRVGPGSSSKDGLAWRTVVRQVLLYPLTLFPAFVLRGTGDERQGDEWAARLTADPQSLAEAYRRMEAMAERVPYRAPFSTRHLFLCTPRTADPLARVFFDQTGFSDRIAQIESGFKTVKV